MCFGSSQPAPTTPDPAPAPAPPALPAEQQQIGSSRRRENRRLYGRNNPGGPQTRRDTSADSPFHGGSGLRM